MQRRIQQRQPVRPLPTWPDDPIFLNARQNDLSRININRPRFWLSSQRWSHSWRIQERPTSRPTIWYYSHNRLYQTVSWLRNRRISHRLRCATPNYACFGVHREIHLGWPRSPRYHPHSFRYCRLTSTFEMDAVDRPHAQETHSRYFFCKSHRCVLPFSPVKKPSHPFHAPRRTRAAVIHCCSEGLECGRLRLMFQPPYINH